MQFYFENHILDLNRRELRRGSHLVDLEPQVFDLLTYLMQNRDRVVSRTTSRISCATDRERLASFSTDAKRSIRPRDEGPAGP